ncbi:DUF5132 domain-containing protein [Streptomyces daliensis]
MTEKINGAEGASERVNIGLSSVRRLCRKLRSDHEDTAGKPGIAARRVVLNMLPVIPVFLVGAASAPLMKKIIRGTVKSSMKLALDAKRVAHEINEDMSDIAAEATAEVFASDLQGESGTSRQTTKKARSGNVST